jgi:hypothetical protein
LAQTPTSSPIADLYDITASLASIDNLGVAEAAAPPLTFGIGNIHHSRATRIQEYPSGRHGLIEEVKSIRELKLLIAKCCI